MAEEGTREFLYQQNKVQTFKLHIDWQKMFGCQSSANNFLKTHRILIKALEITKDAIILTIYYSPDNKYHAIQLYENECLPILEDSNIIQVSDDQYYCIGYTDIKSYYIKITEKILKITNYYIE